MDIDKFMNSSSVIQKGFEATKKMDDEVKEFSGKIPEYVMNSTDIVLTTTVLALIPESKLSITKMLLAHCDHLYMVGFLHGKEKGREAGINYMMGVINPLDN